MITSLWTSGRVALAIVVALVALSATPAASTHAASAVTIESQTVDCDGIAVTYTVQGSFVEETAQLHAHGPGGVVGFASGPGYPDGTHSVTIPVDPTQPGGTMLYASVHVGEAVDQAAPQACPGGEPPGEPPGVPGDAPPPWSGFEDGRLNPAPDEYYSIWCAHNQVEVWRSVPPPSVVLQSIPLLDLVELDDGAELALGDFMVAARSGDAITIYGSNGNLAPAPGSKSFSLNECIARNGGLPAPEDEVLPPPEDEVLPPPEEEEAPLSPEEEAARARQEVQERIEFCFDSYEFLQDLWLFLGCLEDSSALEGASSLEKIWTQIIVLCLTPLTTAIPVVIVLGRRRRARHWPPYPPSDTMR